MERLVQGRVVRHMLGVKNDDWPAVRAASIAERSVDMTVAAIPHYFIHLSIGDIMHRRIARFFFNDAALFAHDLRLASGVLTNAISALNRIRSSFSS